MATSHPGRSLTVAWQRTGKALAASFDTPTSQLSEEERCGGKGRNYVHADEKKARRKLWMIHNHNIFNFAPYFVHIYRSRGKLSNVQ